MKRLLCGFALTLSVQAALASETVLWDNLSGAGSWESFPNASYDPNRRVQADRNMVSGPDPFFASWVVDDAVLGAGARIDAIDWLGSAQPLVAPLGYDRADFAVFTRQDLGGGNFAFTQIGGALNVPVGSFENIGSAPNGDLLYKQRLLVPGGFTVPTDGSYWFGVRLVGNDANQGQGANGFVSRADGVNPLGAPEGGFVRNPLLFPLPPEFRPVSRLPVFNDTPVDFAFRLVNIPEPATCMLLILGGLIGMTRWRHGS